MSPNLVFDLIPILRVEMCLNIYPLSSASALFPTVGPGRSTLPPGTLKEGRF